MRACMHKCLCVCGRVREVTWTEPRFRGCRTERLWGLKTKKETQSTASSFRSQTVERKTRQSGRGGREKQANGKIKPKSSKKWRLRKTSFVCPPQLFTTESTYTFRHIAVNNLCPLHNLWDWHSVLFSYISRTETLWTYTPVSVWQWDTALNHFGCQILDASTVWLSSFSPCTCTTCGTPTNPPKHLLVHL